MNNNTDSQIMLDDAYLRYKKGRHEESVAIYFELAKKGNADAQRFLGWHYLRGFGVTKDQNEARFWFQKAADQNEPMAEWCLGRVCFLENDYKGAKEWFERAAAKGSEPGIHWLGRLYRYGLGVPRDKKKALELFKDAADKGNLRARMEYCVCLILGYEKLSGIPKGINLWIKTTPEVFRVVFNDPEDWRVI